MPTRTFRTVKLLLGLLILVSAAVAIGFRHRWLQPAASVQNEEDEPSGTQLSTAKVLELSPQARQNLKLVSKPTRSQSYWRTVVIPGEVTDRPGFSDRSVTSPVVGIVTQIHAFPGDTVRTGDRLFTLRLLSEYIQNTQSELFKATRETQLLNEQRERIREAAESGGIPRVRLVEIDQQMRRQQAIIQSYRQDLLTRGLNESQIAEVAEGRFVASVDIVAPASIQRPSKDAGQADAPPSEVEQEKFVYELQELKVEIGNQVQAGQLLGVLANHRSLLIEGHAFKREAPFLEQAAQNEWPVQVEFVEDEPVNWSKVEQTFLIHHLANSIDPINRTFKFFILLTNQSQPYEKHGETHLTWRYRPGQRVRLHVPIEEMRDVFVLPAAAIAREGPEAFVFQQNGDLFHRKPVRVLHEDRLNVVIANDGSVPPGLYLAQGGAASLNRVLKAQSASGVPVGMHVHADGTVHGAH